MKKSFKLTIPIPKTRKPVAKKPNSVMKSKKDYTRKSKHKGKDYG
jgi:hypothetical protein